MPQENKLCVAAGTSQLTQFRQLNVQILPAPKLTTNSLLYARPWVLTPLKDRGLSKNGEWCSCIITMCDLCLNGQSQAEDGLLGLRPGRATPGCLVLPSSWDLAPFPSCRVSVSYQIGPSGWRDIAGNLGLVHFGSCVSSLQYAHRSPTGIRPWNPSFFRGDAVLMGASGPSRW